ncbi:MAG: MYXO-CTERM sorting domain-containing protein [Polyangia bacterium]
MALGIAPSAHAKPFEQYIKATPTVAPLTSATWGATGVLPRDISNGIESAKGAGVHPDYYYWDGEIIKAVDGKYHMFMSTFSGNQSFNPGWTSSDAYHAISQTNALGPYVRQDYVYNNGGSHKGHNVSAAQLSDGSYVVVVSEIVPFTIYKSSSLDGPWTGCSPQSDVGMSNISFVERHDGKFEITERNGGLAIADTLCGHYVRQQPKTTYTARNSNTVYPTRSSIPGVSNPTYAYEEDPHIWRSGGTYHIIYSGSGDRVGWHVYSPDGITGWKDNGYAWSPRDYQKIFCYEGTTTCTAWYKMERPGVVLENGHPMYITWAVADVDKDNSIPAGSDHGTKVVVVPFDGVAFDADFGNGGTTGAGGGMGGATGSAGTSGAGGKAGSGGGGAAATGGNSGAAGRAGGSGGVGGGTGGGVGTGGVGQGGSGGSSAGHGGTPGSTGGGSGGTASGSGGSSSGGTPGNGGSTAMPGGNDSSGCSCTVGSATRDEMILPALLLGALGIQLVRRRTRRN